MYKFLIIISFLFMFASCQTTSTGIGTQNLQSTKQSSNFNLKEKSKIKDNAIEALNLSYDEAIEVAYEAGKNAYKQVLITDDESAVVIENRSFWAGDARAIIEPIIVRNENTTGIIFEIKAEGIGSNFSMVPGYLSDGFFKELRKLVKDQNIETLSISNYEKLTDKGITDQISASIPVEYSLFTKFIDNKDDLDTFEGIWEDDKGRYSLGLIRTDNDPRYPYKAFVIESKASKWKPGDVKIKFSKLDNSGVALSKYHYGNKLAKGVTFETSSSSLISINTGKKKIILVKTYPRDKSASRSKGSGTGWYIGNGYFVTNAHVVQNANKINIFSNKKKYSARVALTDKKLDLALINIKDKSIKLPKVSFAEKFDIGQHIYALGFPLGKLLGDNPKITDGIISSNEGLRGDPTIMTISAPIQPGSSGGPVVDDFGRAVGIVVAKLRDSASSDKDVENINYAVKIDYLIPLLKQINFQLTYGKKEKVDVCSSICSSIVRIEVD